MTQGFGEEADIDANVGAGDGDCDGLARARTGGVDWSATAVYAGARGDFTYFDDGGTPYNLEDDAWRAREGNAYDQAEGALRLVLINKDVRAASVRIEPGRRFANGAVSRLVAAALPLGNAFGSAQVLEGESIGDREGLGAVAN